MQTTLDGRGEDRTKSATLARLAQERGHYGVDHGYCRSCCRRTAASTMTSAAEPMPTGSPETGRADRRPIKERRCDHRCL